MRNQEKIQKNLFSEYDRLQKRFNSFFNQSLGLWEDLLLIGLAGVLSLLIRHALNHGHQVASNHVSLLLFGGEGSLGGLQPLFLAFLFFCSLLWIFPDCPLVRVLKVNTLLLRRDVLQLLLPHLVLLIQNRVNSLVHPLGSRSLIVLIICLVQIQNVLKQKLIGPPLVLPLLLLSLLNFKVVPRKL